MKKFSYFKESGFSLVEMLMSMAIMIIGVTAMMAYQSYQNKNIRDIAQGLVINDSHQAMISHFKNADNCYSTFRGIQLNPGTTSVDITNINNHTWDGAGLPFQIQSSVLDQIPVAQRPQICSDRDQSTATCWGLDYAHPVGGVTPAALGVSGGGSYTAVGCLPASGSYFIWEASNPSYTPHAVACYLLNPMAQITNSGPNKIVPKLYSNLRVNEKLGYDVRVTKFSLENIDTVGNRRNAKLNVYFDKGTNHVGSSFVVRQVNLKFVVDPNQANRVISCEDNGTVSLKSAAEQCADLGMAWDNANSRCDLSQDAKLDMMKKNCASQGGGLVNTSNTTIQNNFVDCSLSGGIIPDSCKCVTQANLFYKHSANTDIYVFPWKNWELAKMYQWSTSALFYGRSPESYFYPPLNIIDNRNWWYGMWTSLDGTKMTPIASNTSIYTINPPAWIPKFTGNQRFYDVDGLISMSATDVSAPRTHVHAVICFEIMSNAFNCGWNQFGYVGDSRSNESSIFSQYLYRTPNLNAGDEAYNRFNQMNFRVKGAYRSNIANPRMFISVYAYDDLGPDEALPSPYLTSGPVSPPASGLVWRKIRIDEYRYSIRISGFPQQGKPLYATPL